MRQVEDLKCELARVGWEGKSDCEIEKLFGSIFACYLTAGMQVVVEPVRVVRVPRPWSSKRTSSSRQC